jgi:hypothetical protein
MNPLYLIAAYLLGAISFGVFVLVVMVRLHNKPPSITMAARKAVDVPHTRRQWRDAPERREEGVRYEFMNMTGLEE